MRLGGDAMILWIAAFSRTNMQHPKITGEPAIALPFGKLRPRNPLDVIVEQRGIIVPVPGDGASGSGPRTDASGGCDRAQPIAKSALRTKHQMFEHGQG